MIPASPNSFSPTKRHFHLAQIRALLVLFLCTTFLMVATTRFVAAQDIFGRIVGSVIDPSGAAVPDVKVTITNEATQVSRVVTADKTGYYVVDPLPVGTYT